MWTQTNSESYSSQIQWPVGTRTYQDQESYKAHNQHQPYAIGTVVMPILQMRELRPERSGLKVTQGVMGKH